MPKRIQRKRTKGWRMPEGAVYVGRQCEKDLATEVMELAEAEAIRPPDPPDLQDAEADFSAYGRTAPREPVWEVWQGNTLVCSAKMGLTEREARNKVENERRFGYRMEAKPAKGSL